MGKVIVCSVLLGLLGPSGGARAEENPKPALLKKVPYKTVLSSARAKKALYRWQLETLQDFARAERELSALKARRLRLQRMVERLEYHSRLRQQEVEIGTANQEARKLKD